MRLSVAPFVLKVTFTVFVSGSFELESSLEFESGLELVSCFELDSEFELDDRDSEKATYLIKFFREGGEVIFEKSTRDCVLRRVRTGLSLYPVAYFNWAPSKKCFHGTPPVSAMIPNQSYINTAYAMMMKHMSDTIDAKV